MKKLKKYIFYISLTLYILWLSFMVFKFCENDFSVMNIVLGLIIGNITGLPLGLLLIVSLENAFPFSYGGRI